MPQIKVCGLTRSSDVELCLELGVDRLGFVLAPSRRQLDLQALDRLLPIPGCWTAVLVDPRPELIEELLERGCPSLQFHGSESAEFCSRYQGRARLVKAWRVGGPDFLIPDYPVDEVLLDGAQPGSGQAFDWSWLQGRKPKLPLFLAGGLTPDNVALAWQQVHPDGFDVSSGVEASPGCKDPVRLRRFVRAVRSLA